MKNPRPYKPKTPISTRSAYNNRRTLEEYARQEQILINEGKLDPDEAKNMKNGCYFIGGLFILILALLSMFLS